MKDCYKIPYLDYYKTHGIAPVTQDIADLKKHFERRNALYRHCGIPSAFIEGKSVLEIGPGTGHNALFTNAMKPLKYVLIDGNPRSIQETRNLFNKHFSDISNCEITECSFDNFTSERQFDLVLSEGTIPFQLDPIGFLSKLSKFVKPSGVLLITTVDHVSYLSEVLRKIAAVLIIGTEELSEQDKIKKLKPYFSHHLAMLEGMSRTLDDWIYDSILQPILGRLLSIEDVITCLSEDFDVYGGSPHFFLDWRWYKDIHGSQQQYNEIAIGLYRRNLHNLLDYRYVFEPLEPSTWKEITALCKSVFDLTIQIQGQGISNNCLLELKGLLNNLSSITSIFSSTTAESIRQFICAIDEILSGYSFPNRLGQFEPWFGRGQQYISLIRKSGFPKEFT